MSNLPLNLSLWAARQPWERSVDFVILDNPFSINGGESVFGRRAVVRSLTFEETHDRELIKPTFTLSDRSAQDLFNELWNLDFRPADGTGNSGHIEALRYHLEDIRKLVFSSNKPVGPT